MQHQEYRKQQTKGMPPDIPFPKTKIKLMVSIINHIFFTLQSCIKNKYRTITYCRYLLCLK